MNSFAATVLAATPKAVDPNQVRPGPLALLIVILMCVATFFLLRSFVKHIRKASQPWSSDTKGTKEP